MIHRNCRFFLLLFLGLSTAMPALAAVQARVEPNPVLAGEVFQLEITQSPAGSEEPRLRPLPAGIRELQRQSGQSTQIINGRSSTSRRWVISMIAREPGQHAIEMAPLDGESISPAVITVRAPDPNAGQAPEAFARFEASVDTTWEGAEFGLSLRVYVAGELESGSLPDPAVPGLVLEKLWEDNDKEELIGNTRYRVLQRQYVGFAEGAGTLTIPGPIFSGNVVDRSRRARFPGFSVPTRPVSTIADDIVLTVQPAESRTDAAWLPARGVSFSDEIIPPAGGLEVGQAIKRTIRIQVSGQLHTQLPDFQWPLPDRATIQSFAEDPNSVTKGLNGGVQAQIEQTFVHIPRAAGSVVLPAIRLPWFNTDTGRWDESELPERRLTIRAAAGSTAAMPTDEPQAVTPPSVATKESRSAPTANQAFADNSTSDATVSDFWRWLALGSLAGWALTLGAWVVVAVRQGQSRARTASADLRDHKQALSLREACKRIRDGEAAEAESAVLSWARHAGLIDGGSGLLQLAMQVQDTALAEALRELSAARYGNGTWSAETLLKALRNTKAPSSRAHRSADDALPPLYPR